MGKFQKLSVQITILIFQLQLCLESKLQTLRWSSPRNIRRAYCFWYIVNIDLVHSSFFRAQSPSTFYAICLLTPLLCVWQLVVAVTHIRRGDASPEDDLSAGVRANNEKMITAALEAGADINYQGTQKRVCNKSDPNDTLNIVFVPTMYTPICSVSFVRCTLIRVVSTVPCQSWA